MTMAPPGRQSSILVVDDQATSRELLLGYLESLPCQVRQAASGESALAAVAEAPPDLILLDVLMPGLNGFAVTQRLKGNPRTATIPVVLITSLRDSVDRLKGLQAGADEFLTKPVDRAEFVARVQTLLRLKRLRDERQAVGDLGQRALSGVELPVLMDEAAALLAYTLRADYAAIWELRGAGDRLRLWAGEGWREGLVGQAEVSAEADSPMGHTLLSGVPIVVEDLRSDNRFQGPRLLHEHDVISGISVVIDGPDRRAGVLSVHTRTPRAFTRDDIYFAEAVAQVLATAIVRKRAEAERIQALLCERVARTSLEESQRTLAQTTRAKSDFLASLSHEMHTPVGSILGSADRLLERLPDGEDGAEARQLVGDIQDGVRRLERLAQDVLDLTRLEAGQLEAQPAAVPLSEAVQAVEATIRPLAEKKGLTLVSRLYPETLTAYADRTKLEQVLHHLLSNAVRFTPPGGLVETTAIQVDGMVKVVVADTGIGIAAEDQERIFEPFRQLDGAAALQDKGNGLGLAVARQLVELQGGRLWVESALGQGSRFGFTLPAQAAAPCESEVRQLPAPALTTLPAAPAVQDENDDALIGAVPDPIGYPRSQAPSGPDADTWTGSAWLGLDDAVPALDSDSTPRSA